MSETLGADERDILQQVLNAFAMLDEKARIRFLKTIATFFNLDLVGVEAEAGIQRPSTSLGTTPTREPVFAGHASLSPKEFMLEKASRTDVDRVVCLAYYLSHYRDKPHFKTSDISKLNTEAAQRKLANAAYAVNNATQGGYLAQAPGGLKQLSVLGEQYVEVLPDREAGKAVLERLRPRRSRVYVKTRKARAGKE
jgi:hypothetical protein